MSEKPEKENMRVTLFTWTALCCLCMAVMLYFSANKAIVIADGYQERPQLSGRESVGEGSAGGNAEQGMESGPAGFSGQQDRKIRLENVYGIDGSFSIPLPEEVGAEQIRIENHYIDRELWIYIQCGDAAFYQGNRISGDVSEVRYGIGEPQEDGILLKLRMNRVFEYRNTMEGDSLTIVYYEPHELYEYVVVLDPEGGGSDVGYCGEKLAEKELTLQVAQLVQKNWNISDVRLYLTRTEDRQMSAQERVSLTEEVDADFYICLGAQADSENPEKYGIMSSYNEEYFIPDFGNVELADVVTRAVTIAAQNRALGLFPAAEDSILGVLETRGVRVSLGYLSNPQEEELLSMEAYQEKLAAGIVDAVEEAVDGVEAAEK